MSLHEHLLSAEGHGRLAFRADCPRCRVERLVGPPPREVAVPTRATAGLVAGVLAASSTLATVPIAASGPATAAAASNPTGVEEESEGEPSEDPGDGGSTVQEGVADSGSNGIAESEDPTLADPEAPAAPAAPAPAPAPTPPPATPAPPVAATPAPPPTPAAQTPPAPAVTQATPTATTPTPAVATTTTPAPPAATTTTPQPAPAPSVEPESGTQAALGVGEAPERKAKPEHRRQPQRPAQAAPRVTTAAPAPAPEPAPAATPVPGPAPASAAPAAARPATVPVAAKVTAPAAARPATVPVAAKVTVRAGDATHVVRAGESLWSIARALAGPAASSARVAALVQELWQLNAARIGTGTPDLIHPGDALRLPRSASA
ncbi:MAG TPA: LysM domain-containing protein [Solirubrobacteraceae bacterium]|nr:LysM domain-containing protein [Solirubrobacteraceae bacterium]